MPRITHAMALGGLLITGDQEAAEGHGVGDARHGCFSALIVT